MKRILLLFTLLLLVGCSELTYFFDYDKEQNFTEFKTYKWGLSDKDNDALENHVFFKKQLIMATDSNLTNKGFSLIKDSTTETDFIVVLYGIIQADTSVVTTVDSPSYYGAAYYPSYGRIPPASYSYGWYDPWYHGGSVAVGINTGPQTATTSLSIHKEGTLIFDIVNAKTKELVWRGTAEATLQGKLAKSSMEKQTNVIHTIVTSVLQNFPPPPAKKP